MTDTRAILVLGGARSGKSRYAETVAESCGRMPIVIATAEASDAEMEARIARHRADRSSDWQVVEEPLALADVLRREARPERILVVDCLTLWLSNLMCAGRDPEAETRELVACLEGLAGPVILVSNEVGAGIVPANAMARAFRDAQGRLNQALARRCDKVVLVVAGCPLAIKPAPAPDLGL